MSWKVVKLVIDAAPVRDTPLVLLLALAEWSQDDGVSWHPIDDIARRARCSIRRAREVIEALSTPDAEGRTLLEVRRSKRTTFYEINLGLLLRLNAEQTGQATLWPVENTEEKRMKSLGNDVEKPEEKLMKTCGAAVHDEADGDLKSANLRTKSANLRTSSLLEPEEPEQPKEPEATRPAGDTVIEAESVVVLVKKLSSNVGFPPSPALTSPQLEARRRFLKNQLGVLKQRGLL